MFFQTSGQNNKEILKMSVNAILRMPDFSCYPAHTSVSPFIMTEHPSLGKYIN